MLNLIRMNFGKKNIEEANQYIYWSRLTKDHLEKLKSNHIQYKKSWRKIFIQKKDILQAILLYS